MPVKKVDCGLSIFLTAIAKKKWRHIDREVRKKKKKKKKIQSIVSSEKFRGHAEGFTIFDHPLSCYSRQSLLKALRF